MTKKELMSKFQQLLEESHTGILATVSPEGYPSMRYMTPAMIPKRPDHLFAVTSSSFPKANDLLQNSLVSWMFTSQKSREIFSFRGKITVIENPRFKSEILEELGRGLETFWRLNDDPSTLICLETTLVSAEYFNPKTAEKTQVTFASEE